MDTDRLYSQSSPSQVSCVLWVSLPDYLDFVVLSAPGACHLQTWLAAWLPPAAAWELWGSLCSPAACASCQSPRGNHRLPATPAQAQWPSTPQRAAMRAASPELPLPKPSQGLPTLQPVPETLDSPVPAATAALVALGTVEWLPLVSSKQLYHLPFSCRWAILAHLSLPLSLSLHAGLEWVSQVYFVHSVSPVPLPGTRERLLPLTFAGIEENLHLPPLLHSSSAFLPLKCHISQVFSPFLHMLWGLRT